MIDKRLFLISVEYRRNISKLQSVFKILKSSLSMNDQEGKSAPGRFADPQSSVAAITKSLSIINKNINIKFKYLIVYHKPGLVRSAPYALTFSSDDTR